jgi:hypothetical protein
MVRIPAPPRTVMNMLWTHITVAISARSNARAVVRRATAPVIAAAVAIACGSASPPAQTDPVPNLDSGQTLQWQARPAIVQTLRLLNAHLRQGDTLRLESTLRNVSNQVVTVERVVCELDIETSMQLESPFIHCFAYSTNAPMEPGERASSILSRVVTAPPGRYTIAIRHLLDPDVWVPAELTVHPR